mgnify:CR=1 FL=1
MLESQQIKIGDIVRVDHATQAGSPPRVLCALGLVIRKNGGPPLKHLYYMIQLFGEKHPVPVSADKLKVVSHA